MELIYIVFWFVLGVCFGSFFHVVGYRLPKGESLLHPKRSYCSECGHELKTIDLVPIFSFLLCRRRCRYCKKKISWFYFFLEVMTGCLYAGSFYLFGFSYEFFMMLVLVSMFSVILVSDSLYYIIPDEVIVTGGLLLIIGCFVNFGLKEVFINIGNGVLMFLFMYLIMVVGKLLLKKECLGGADVKLLFISGFVLGPFLSFCVIFLSSVFALPVAIGGYLIRKENILPYGPFIMFAIVFLFGMRMDAKTVLDFLVSIM